MTEDQKDGSTP